MPEYHMLGYLVSGGGACPEQYEVKKNGVNVAYLRLRHGYFYAACPDVGGEVVYSDTPEGDGCFYENERGFYLSRAVQAVDKWVKEHDKGNLYF